MEEWHEDPYFNGQQHLAVWCKSWVSGGTADLEAPEGVPITCAICGKPKGANP